MNFLKLNTLKKATLFSAFFISLSTTAQVFWTENFGTSACTSVLANGCNASGNGVWLTTNTGVNQPNANNWFVSAKEAGMGVGNCGNGCGTISTLTNRTLHIGSTFIIVDPGAAYLAGTSSNTDKRAESPIINCTGRNGINMSFKYLSKGIPGSDFFTVYYFDGATWNVLSTPGSSPTGTCAPQGLWTAYNVALPASADNNPSVKIGFRWVNVDPTGSDPSVAIDDIVLTASPIPPLTLTLPSPVCVANTINATFTSTITLSTFTWSATSPNVVFTPPNSGTTTISFTAPGTYTISLTGCNSGTNCATIASSIQVLPTPTINVTASPTVVCLPGGSSTLTATGGPSASSYTWTASSGPAIPNVSVTVVSPVVTTNYTVQTSVPGCTTGISFNVPVSPSPTITVTPNSGICNGQSASLTASGGATYTWSPSGTLSSANGAAVNATPNVTTTYTVTGNNGVCSNTAAVTVSVAPAANVTLTPTSSTICAGQTTTLTATGSTTYTWTASNGANPSATTGIITVTPTTSTTYTVLTGSGSCTATAVSSVSVLPSLTITATPNNTTICSGGSGVAIVASGASTYTWSPATGLSSTSGSNVTANPPSTTNYIITGSNGVCSATTSANVSVTIANTTVTASSANYCTGGAPVTLTGSGATTYSWSPAAGLSSTTGAVVTATPVTTTVYSVTGTTGSCTSIKTVTITVPVTSSISIVSSGTLICSGGGGTTLTASGAATYTWLPGSATTASINANPTTTTTYTVGGITAAGCVALPATITVSVNPAISPIITAASNTVCLSQTVAISVSATGTGLTYSWTPIAAIQGTSNTATIVAKPTTTANVIYTVTVSNGLCTGTATVSLLPQLCTPPVATIQTISNDSICTNGCVTFTAQTTGSTPITYQWFFPGGTPPTSNLASPVICYFAKGDYTVSLVATNAYGTDTVIKNNYINVADTPAVVHAFGDTLIRIGQTAIISANGGLTYYWYPNINNNIACPTCSSTVVQPTVTTNYIVEAGNSPYCKRTDTVLVKVDFTCGDFFVPTAFSPNNDGLNDLINVHGFCIATFNLQIFSRWGEKVFETSTLSESWDGTYKGKNLDTGVFVYKADGITIDGKPFSIKGNITLIR